MIVDIMIVDIMIVYIVNVDIMIVDIMTLCPFIYLTVMGFKPTYSRTLTTTRPMMISIFRTFLAGEFRLIINEMRLLT